MTLAESPTEVYARVTQAMTERLPKNLRIRRTLPHDGRLRIDRQLPFLCVYRRPQDRDDSGTRELITTEASYLAACADETHAECLSSLCDHISRMMVEHFGVFLFLEIWSQPTWPSTQFPFRPRFTIVTSDHGPLQATVASLKESLSRISLGRLAADVDIAEVQHVCPPGMPPLVSPEFHEAHPAIFGLGLAVAPFFRNERDGQVYPVLLQQLRRPLAQAIRSAVSTFATSFSPSGKTVHVYGPSSMVKAARDVDQQLGEIATSFDFLLQVTPVNSDDAWEEFDANGQKHVPDLVYRPLPYDPGVLKRRLYQMPLEEVEDPTLSQLLEEKQIELDRQLSALRDLNTSAFVHHSLQIYGGVEQELYDYAIDILKHVPPHAAPEPHPHELMPPKLVAELARDEINHYHSLAPAFSASVDVVDHIAAGLMVSRDRLFISEHLQIRPERVNSILQHEVGTHLLTYFNGRQQPLRQLAAGLANYEGLQEGLAILAEYLAGGLTPGRLRTLAARVLAVWNLTKGASFLETHHWLRHDFGIPAHVAFSTTLRVYRGGGLTKDAVYLRGFRDLLGYLREGRGLEPLYVGKIALEHVVLIQELRRRDIVQPPVLLPRFFSDPDLKHKLETCASCSILELLEKQP